MSGKSYEEEWKILLDPRLEAYRGYIDDARLHKILDQIPGGCQFSTRFSSLMLDLRGFSYAASMPNILANSLANFARGAHSQSGPAGQVMRAVPILLNKLKEHLPSLIKQERMARKIETRLTELASQYARVNLPESYLQMDPMRIWQQMLEERVFGYGAWATQKLAFLSIFSSYDNFLARVVKDALKIDKCRTTETKQFTKHLKNAFGEQAAMTCWLGPEVTRMKKARHSLAHAGGQVTVELEKIDHGFPVVDDKIQVMPDEIKLLICHIFAAVEEIISESGKRDNLTHLFIESADIPPQ